MNFAYHFGIRMYGWGIRLAAPFVPKARQWVQGRKDWKNQLRQALGSRKGWIWMHCSSLGEFEQGRPLLEKIRSEHPGQALLLTFFSPSGYLVRKSYPVVDHVAYLPLDTPGNARAFLDLVQPRLAFFVKYDLWLNHLAELQARKVPHFLVSALLRPDSRFLRSRLKNLYRKAFLGFAHIFAQDEGTVHLLREFVGEVPVVVTGDTRFDRVVQLPDQFQALPEIEAFVGGRTCIVAGSPHAPDEKLLLPAIERLRRPGLCWIVAPHEIDREAILKLAGEDAAHRVVHSQYDGQSTEADVLWVDRVGLLGRLYHYAAAAYIGGGFGGGIHNTQEPAVYGIPILFGPKYQGFQEAVDMVEQGGARVVRDADELVEALNLWLNDESLRQQLGSQNAAYMNDQAGATQQIWQLIAPLFPPSPSS